MPLLLASELSESFEKAIPYLPKINFGLVTIINTASIGEGVELNFETEIKPFKNMGYDVELFDLSSRGGGGVIEQLAKSDICYVAGGNTFFLLEHIQKTNFEKCLRERMESDFLYIGSSAGSIVMSPDINFIAPMDDKSCANLESTEGLGFIKFSFLPHVGHMSMGKAAQEIKELYSNKTPLMCFSDTQAIYVDGNCIEVL